MLPNLDPAFPTDEARAHPIHADMKDPDLLNRQDLANSAPLAEVLEDPILFELIAAL
ncbi:hypothetical protein HK101_005850, partial [Irineochytrium annulatum]